VLAVAENPNRKGMLFAERAHFFYSLDDGALENVRRTAAQRGVVDHRPQAVHDVIVSTYGRGIFILRDIAPLEQIGRRRRRRNALSAASWISAGPHGRADVVRLKTAAAAGANRDSRFD
jgi:hypothetical protein